MARTASPALHRNEVLRHVPAKRWRLLALLLLTLLALSLRLYRLGDANVWWDKGRASGWRA